MKREGRQHGMVRCYQIIPQPLNPRPESRYLNRFDSPPTNGLFTRVSTKPTNHSKFTGKCGRTACRGCHSSPACKSMDKTKGAQKLRLVTRRISDYKQLYGFSAAEFLDQMDEDDDACEDEDGVYQMSCETEALSVDIKDHDEDDCKKSSYGIEDNDCVNEVHEMSCEIEPLASDNKDHTKNEYENKGNDIEDDDWYFIEETF